MDIDIDIHPDVDPTKFFRNITRASRVEKGQFKEHLVGYYLQDIPIDKITGLAAIPYTETEKFGFMKIDLLTVNLLKYFDSKKEMKELLKEEPDWLLLENENVVSTLFHIGKHFDIISKVKPRSIEQLADIFALIRPNKRALLNKYIEDPDTVREELFTKRDSKDMRKAHAIPYAMMIVLQLHLIKQGRYTINETT